LAKTDKVISEQSANQTLKKTFDLFNRYVVQIVGEKKSFELATNTLLSIEGYYKGLTVFKLHEDHQLEIDSSEITEKEILGFSIWMQQFLKEVKELMIGLGRVDVKEITAELKVELEALSFYDYFEQAKELNY
jgi:hypothetical protein